MLEFIVTTHFLEKYLRERDSLVLDAGSIEPGWQKWLRLILETCTDPTIIGMPTTYCIQERKRDGLSFNVPQER